MTRKSSAKTGSNAINENHHSPSSHHSHSPGCTSPGEQQDAVVKKGWEWKKLSEICVVDKCQGIHKNLPYVGLEHIESHTGRFVGSTEPASVKSSTFKFSQEHVLFGRLRPYLNKVMLPDFIGHCSTEIFPLKPCLGMSREFLQYWFLRDTSVELINETSTGARMPRANINTVLNFAFPLPPLPEQQRIVKILDEAFAGIAAVKSNAEKNLANARELFESHLQAVFSQKGDGWVEKRLGDVCSIGDGNYSSKYPKASEFLSSGIPFLTATNLKDGTITPEGIRFISLAQHSQLLKGHVKKGDLVIVVRGSSTGNSSIVPQHFDGSNLNSQLAFLRPGENLSDRYLFYSFKSPQVQGEVRKKISGAAQPQLPNNKLLDIQICYPSFETQNIVVSKLDTLHKETQHLESLYRRKLDALDELKKALLHKAFNGEL